MKLMAIATTMPPGGYGARHRPMKRITGFMTVKPLYAAIGCVLAPYWPSGRRGHRHCLCVKTQTKHNF